MRGLGRGGAGRDGAGRATVAAMSNTAGAPLMLGVSGLRGIVGSSLTPEVASRYAATVGTWLVERAGVKAPARWPGPLIGRPLPKDRVKVVLGLDGRVGGQVVADAASAGLRAAGCDVIPVFDAMTPTVGVMVDHLGADAGVQVTASHNPQEWNGLKVLLRRRGLKGGVVDACAPAKALAGQIVERFKGAGPEYRSWQGVGIETFFVQTSPHVERVLGRLEELGALRAIRRGKIPVLLDSVNGAGGVDTPLFLGESLGCKVTALGEEPGRPFWHTPEPTAANLSAVRSRVKKAGAAVGFCQDPDADRLALIDERGRYVGEEYTLVLAAWSLCEAGAVRKGSTMVVNLSTSRMIEDVAGRYGVRVERAAVGEANVVEAMKRLKSPLGGEGNGGVIWPGVTYVRDSLGAMGLVLALMAREKKALSELAASIPAYAIEKRKVDLARQEDARPAVEKLSRRFRDQELDTQDGVRVNFPQERAWLHVRASNTEPIMRLIAEAPTAGAARGLLDEAARAIAG